MGKAFNFLQAPQLPIKPRKKALFIGSDDTLVYPLQKAYLEEYHDIIDVVKFTDHLGLAGRYTEEWFRRKISLYQKYKIPFFPGGVSFELAVLQKQVIPFFKRLKRLGFSGLEISEDIIPPMPLRKRAAMIKEAAGIGLQVYTEVGRKYPDRPFDLKEAIDSVKFDLEAGSLKVTVEGAEIQAVMRGDGKPDDLVRLTEAVGVENLVFESGPGPFPQTTIWLIKTIGVDVNLESIALAECNTVYKMRLGMTRAMEYEFLTKKGGIVE